MSFEPNEGQANPRVRFLSHGAGYSVLLDATGAFLSLERQAKGSSSSELVRMQLVNANPMPELVGDGLLAGKVNYFRGNDPSKWRRNIPLYAQVHYRSVYPGVDLVYYGNQHQLEYDFKLAPGADPKRVRLQFAGAKKLMLDAEGNLAVAGEHGHLVFLKPVVYQQHAGRRETVAGRFQLVARNRVAFALGEYDRSRELVIDPVLAYSTYLGGGGDKQPIGDTQANGVAVDSTGAAYVTGQTTANNFPLSSPYQSINKGEPNQQPNAFVTKLSPDGKTLVYSTYLGGSGSSAGGSGDDGAAIAVDSGGNAYICGGTASTDFPTTAGAFQRTNLSAKNGVAGPFVSKLDPSGSALVYSTFIAGSGDGNGDDDGAHGIAVDTSGNAYITGITFSTDFPIKNPYQSSNHAAAGGSPNSNAFVTKLNSTGSALIYSTYLGGSGTMGDNVPTYEGDNGLGIAVDSSGNAYVVGQAGSDDFPKGEGTPYQATNHGQNIQAPNAFAVKFNPSGSALIYSTYLGGSGRELATPSVTGYQIDGDVATRVAIDSGGNAYITGFAFSTNFPVTKGVIQSSNLSKGPVPSNAFVAKLNPTGSTLAYSTYLGGSGAANYEFGLDYGSDIKIDSAGNAYVTGETVSTNFPVTSNAFQTHNETTPQSESAFLSELNPTATALVFSTYLGGHGISYLVPSAVGFLNYSFGDYGTALALDGKGGIYVAGASASTDFPTTAGTSQNVNRSTATFNAFVTKFSTSTAAATNTGTYLRIASSVNPQNEGSNVTFTATVRPRSGSGVPTGVVAFSIDGSTPIEGPLNSAGEATFSTSSLHAGVIEIGAAYLGSSNYLASDDIFYQVVDGTNGTSIATYSGNDQFSKLGTPFPDPLEVEVEGSNGFVASGATVKWGGTGLSFSSASSVTNANGIAIITATPTAAGNLTAVATTSGAPYNASFTLTGTGAANAATPTFSPAAGTYTGAQSVKIADATSGVAIFYTTNGSTPTTSSAKYTGAIVVSSPETVKAIAVASGHGNSAVASATYTIK